LWAKAGVALEPVVESKRVDAFENMSDEELRQYVYGNKELDA
jgi:hypothetical protein